MNWNKSSVAIIANHNHTSVMRVTAITATIVTSLSHASSRLALLIIVSPLHHIASHQYHIVINALICF